MFTASDDQSESPKSLSCRSLSSSMRAITCAKSFLVFINSMRSLCKALNDLPSWSGLGTGPQTYTLCECVLMKLSMPSRNAEICITMDDAGPACFCAHLIHHLVGLQLPSMTSTQFKTCVCHFDKLSNAISASAGSAIGSGLGSMEEAAGPGNKLNTGWSSSLQVAVSGFAMEIETSSEKEEFGDTSPDTSPATIWQWGYECSPGLRCECSPRLRRDMNAVLDCPLSQ